MTRNYPIKRGNTFSQQKRKTQHFDGSSRLTRYFRFTFVT